MKDFSYSIVPSSPSSTSLERRFCSTSVSLPTSSRWSIRCIISLTPGCWWNIMELSFVDFLFLNEKSKRVLRSHHISCTNTHSHSAQTKLQRAPTICRRLVKKHVVHVYHFAEYSPLNNEYRNIMSGIVVLVSASIAFSLFQSILSSGGLLHWAAFQASANNANEKSHPFQATTNNYNLFRHMNVVMSTTLTI